MSNLTCLGDLLGCHSGLGSVGGSGGLGRGLTRKRSRHILAICQLSTIVACLVEVCRELWLRIEGVIPGVGMVGQRSTRTGRMIDRAVCTARGAGVAVLVAGFSLLGWPTAAAASVTAVQAPASADVAPVKESDNEFRGPPHSDQA